MCCELSLSCLFYFAGTLRLPSSQPASSSLGYVNNCTSRRLPHLGATSQWAYVSYAVHQVGMELQSPVASTEGYNCTNCATPFRDIRHWLPAKHFPCHSVPATVGRPRLQDSSTDTPILALPARSQAMIIFQEDTVGIEPRTCEHFAEL